MKISFFSLIVALIFLTSCKESEEDIQEKITKKHYVYFELDGDWKVYQSDDYSSITGGGVNRFTLTKSEAKVIYEIHDDYLDVVLETPEGDFECTCEFNPDDFIVEEGNLDLSNDARMKNKKFETALECEGIENAKMSILMSMRKAPKKSPLIKRVDFEEGHLIGKQLTSVSDVRNLMGDKLSSNFWGFDVFKDGSFAGTAVLYGGYDFDLWVLYDVKNVKDTNDIQATIMDVLIYDGPVNGMEWLKAGNCGEGKEIDATYFVYFNPNLSSADYLTSEEILGAYKIDLEKMKFKEVRDRSNIMCVNPKTE